MMYMSTNVEVFCHQAIENGLDWEEIQALCQKRSAMLAKWMPESMDDVRLRARQHLHNHAMREWYRRAPRPGDTNEFDIVDALTEWTESA